MGYLRETDRTGDKARLAPRLAQAKITNDRLLAHLKTLQSGVVAPNPAPRLPLRVCKMGRSTLGPPPHREGSGGGCGRGWDSEQASEPFDRG